MSTYEHGSQDITAHQGTYGDILNVLTWSGMLIGLSTLYISMVFAGGMNWLGSLVVVYVISLLVGFVLKRGTTWYGVMTGLTVLTVIIGWMTGLIAALI